MVNSDSFDDLEFVLRLPADWLFGLERERPRIEQLCQSSRSLHSDTSAVMKQTVLEHSCRCVLSYRLIGLGRARQPWSVGACARCAFRVARAILPQESNQSRCA